MDAAQAEPVDWAAELAWLRQQQQLARFRQALDRKHGRGKMMIPEGRVENVHLMSPEERSAAIRASVATAAPFFEAVVRMRSNRKLSERACQAGRWRLSAGRARPRTRGVRRTANATRGSPSDDPHLGDEADGHRRAAA